MYILYLYVCVCVCIILSSFNNSFYYLLLSNVKYIFTYVCVCDCVCVCVCVCVYIIAHMFSVSSLIVPGPVCKPRCSNGGRCVSHHRCQCQKGYKGAWCQNRTYNKNKLVTSDKRLFTA